MYIYKRRFILATCTYSVNDRLTTEGMERKSSSAAVRTERFEATCPPPLSSRVGWAWQGGRSGRGRTTGSSWRPWHRGSRSATAVNLLVETYS